MRLSRYGVAFKPSQPSTWRAASIVSVVQAGIVSPFYYLQNITVDAANGEATVSSRSKTSYLVPLFDSTG